VTVGARFEAANEALDGGFRLIRSQRENINIFRFELLDYGRFIKLQRLLQANKEFFIHKFLPLPQMTYIKVAKDIRQNRKNSKYIVRIHTA